MATFEELKAVAETKRVMRDAAKGTATHNFFWLASDYEHQHKLVSQGAGAFRCITCDASGFPDTEPAFRARCSGWRR